MTRLTWTIGAGGLIATPDAPAIFFWAATLAVLGRIFAGGNPRLWLLAGTLATAVGPPSSDTMLLMSRILGAPNPLCQEARLTVAGLG